MLSIVAKQDIKDRPVAVLYGETARDGHVVTLKESLGDMSKNTKIQVEENECLALEPTHDKNGRDVIMVGGKSGSGKSHVCKNFAIRYNKLWPDRKIVMVSALKKDATLDSVPFVKRLKAESFLDNPPKLEEFDQSLTIFDDIEGFEKENKKLHAALQRTIDMIATTGRHNASSMIVSSHLLTDYKRTRLFLGEAHAFCVFPHGCSMKQMTNLLGGYAGADQKDIDKMRQLNSRWVTVRTSFPPVVIHEKGAHLLYGKGDKKKRKRGDDSDSD